MIRAEVPAATAPVENGREVWKVAVQVDVLGVGPTICPAI